MTELTYDPEHAARGVDRIIDRYRKPRTSALLASWLSEVQAVEDALWQLYVERSLATAEGDQLDVLGAIVGQPRDGMGDDTYRIWIRARNLVSRSSGKTTEMLAIARLLVPPPSDPGDVRLEEYYPAAMVIRITSPVTLELGYQIAHMLHLAKAGGVRFQMTWMETPLLAFRMAPTPGGESLGSSQGFDSGVFATVSDGATIPVIPDEPPVPLGQVMIQGVPVVIQGVPLVITPPGAMAAARVPTAPTLAPRLPTIIAKPASIVPRPLALPMPLVGATVELADAFDDSTLEMNATGDKFRVDDALVDVIESTAATVTSQGSDITTLQGAVAGQGSDITALQAADVSQHGDIAALQSAVTVLQVPLLHSEPFTLRTTNTDSTVYEEIGVLRFDATPYAGTATLVAELSVAVAGQTVDLQLYNLTAGTLVATVTSTSVTTEKKTSALTLPTSEALYSVRLRRTGGDVTQRVSCRSASLQVSHA